MSVINTIFYREAETEIVMFVVHLYFHEVFMKRSYIVKFIYSERATKFCEISTNYLTCRT